jgi:ParB-like chromosome segregation protein Spo0J
MAKNAFDAKRSNLYLFDPDDLVIIGLDTDDGPEHPLWDKRATEPVDQKLVANIKALGKILVSISVRKNGEKAEVIQGRRRVKAARALNEELRKEGREIIRVPATVERADDSKSFGMMVSENELRENDGPMAKARKVQRYIDLGNGEEDAAKIFGVTLNGLKLYLKLLDLVAPVQKLVEDGKMSASAAANLSDLPREEQKAQADKLIAEGKATIGDVRAAVKRHKSDGMFGENENIVKAPGKKVLKRLLKRNDELVEDERLDPMFIKGIKFAMGEIGPSVVKGLKAMMADEWK